MIERQIDLTGKQCGRLFVLREAEPSRRAPGKGFRRNWKCKCECGAEVIVGQDQLRKNRHNTSSCGCLRREVSAKNGSKNWRHGESRHAGDTTEYRIWHGIIQRCCNPNDQAYKWYGARGITVCAQWRNSFEDFLAGVGRRPSSGLTLDRKDNDGNYEPGNVRWATRQQQVRNSRIARLIEFNGEQHCITEWAEITGITADAIYLRLKDGWSIQRSLITPLRVTARTKKNV